MDALLSPRRRSLLQATAAAALLTACGRTAGGVAAFEYRGPTMGSAYTLKLAGRTLATALANEAHEAVATALAHVDRTMTTHRADAELGRFNAHASTAPFALSAATFEVMSLAARVSGETGGAFDATVAPIVDAWGFGADRRPHRPDASSVASLAPGVGFRLIALDGATRTAIKARADVRADLSGIAKGYGVDAAARALDDAGIEHYLVEAGGEVRTRGTNAHGAPWQVAIEQPDATPQRPHVVVPLSGLSMATSGDYRIYFEQDGRRYCHEIDPATSAPIANGVASVSVVAADCAYADAMATALMVMGAERGLAFAQSRGLAAYFLVRDGAALRPLASDAFAKLGAHKVS